MKKAHFKEFFARYIENKVLSRHFGRLSLVKIVGCVVLYVLLIAFMNTLPIPTHIIGVLAQIHVIISIFLVISIPGKHGYVTAVLLNIARAFMVAVVFVMGRVEALPGIFVPLFKVFVVTLLYSLKNRLSLMLDETQKQKEELVLLSNELCITQAEFSSQSERLALYSKIMHESERQIEHLSYFDLLTNLPNRTMIISRLNLLITIAQKKELEFAMVLINLDNFHHINYSIGHVKADQLLQAAAGKLKSAINTQDILGRLGGDEFVLLIQRPLTKKQISDYVQSLRVSLLECKAEKNILPLSASFGICLYPQDATDTAELLTCIDTAMQRAKEKGKNRIQFFSRQMREELIKHITLENKLASAVANGEITVVYQPLFDTLTQSIRGFEALARWRCPGLGMISPVQFIPMAEDTGLIISLGEWILHTCCERFATLNQTQGQEVMLSVNISVQQIIEPGFVDMVKKTLRTTGFPACLLELEVTESVFISGIEPVSDTLKKLKALGIRIALDDFGTGYSSLSYLCSLPIDTLKIDKSLIDGISTNDEHSHIVGSVISLAHKLGMSVVAEGVENDVQLAYLKQSNCDFVQGFLLGKPLDNHALDSLVKKSAYTTAATSSSGKLSL